MKAILIDPINRTITEVDHSGDFHEIYKLCDFETFTCITVDQNQDTLYIDDEGLLKITDAFFLFDSYPQPLAGKGLLLGTKKGESVSCKMTLDQVKAKVKFMNGQDAYIWAMQNHR